MELRIENICKSFNGRQILHDLSFTAQSGRAMGFLGRNGAGKTTTIRALMDVFKADSGRFLLDGKPLNKKSSRLGYLPEERGMYAKSPLLDQLIYFGELKHMKRKDAERSARQWLERMELSDYLRKELGTLSKGNQQKVQIVQAVIDDPDILILDEPFSGLDPVNAQALKSIIFDFIGRDRIVIFSSHQMSLVEEFCDDISLIRLGKILFSGSLIQLKDELGRRRIRVRLEGAGREEEKRVFAAMDGVRVSEDKESLILELPEEMGQKAFLQTLLREDRLPSSFEPYRPSLESIFIQMDFEAAEREKAAAGAACNEIVA